MLVVCEVSRPTNYAPSEIWQMQSTQERVYVLKDYFIDNQARLNFIASYLLALIKLAVSMVPCLPVRSQDERAVNRSIGASNAFLPNVTLAMTILLLLFCCWRERRNITVGWGSSSVLTARYGKLAHCGSTS